MSQFCLRFAQDLFSALSVLDIGTCSVPFNDLSQLVAQRHCADEQPAKFPVSPPQACFSFQRFPSSQGRPPLFQEPCKILLMNCNFPAPIQPVLQRETRIFQPTLILELSGTVRQSAPDQSGNCIDNKSKLIF